MRRRNKLITTILMMVMVLPLFLGLGSAKDVMATDSDPEPEVTEQKVTLHKLKYTLSGDETLPTIENTGDELEKENLGGGVPLAGAEFTAYDVTKDYWAAYDDSTETTDAKRTEDAMEAVKAATSTTNYTFVDTGMNGLLTKNLPIKSKDAQGRNRNAIYRFVETKTPGGVVAGSSASFILGLPIYEAATSSLKKEVHIYPKNEFKTVNLEFTKYGVATPGNAVPLNGARFVLQNEAEEYYAAATNNFTTKNLSEAKVFTSDGNDENTEAELGKVLAEDLVLGKGKYHFIEVDSTKATIIDSYDAAVNDKYYYSNKPAVTVTVNSDMTVEYDYYNINGAQVTNGTSPVVYNYKVPVVTKVVDDDDADMNQTVTFHITHELPDKLDDYTTYSLVDTFDSKLELSDAEFANIQEYFEDFGATIKLDGNKFTVIFSQETLKDQAGKEIDLYIKMSLSADVEMNDKLTNTIEFVNNIDNNSATATVTTSGKKFKKVDNASDATLAGARFYVKRVIDRKTEYLVAVNGIRDWKTVTFDESGNPKVDTTTKLVECESGSDGTFQIDGLSQKKDGTENLIQYYLEEFEAPDGYVLSSGDVPFNADGGVVVLDVPNKHKGSLPSTGGSGIVAFVLIGVVAVGGAVLYFTKGRRQIEG